MPPTGTRRAAPQTACARQVGRECTYVASVRMWPTSLGGRHPAWPAPTSPYGWSHPARGAGSPEPGWLAVPKRTARAGQPWPARVARAAQPGWPDRPASVLGAPCFDSPAVRSTRGPPWTTWSTRAPLLSLAACRQQRLAAMAADGSGRSARRARKGRRAPRARGHRPRSAASTASSSCARPSACAVIIMSCGVWVNSVKSMLGKLIIHLESQAQELTNHTHTRPWLLTEGVLGWWSGEHMRTRSPTPGGGRAGRHAARSAGVCGAATATPRARTRRPRRQGCLPRRAARARTAPASLDSRS